MNPEKRAVLRWKRGHEAARAKQLELLAAEGPQPDQAMAELDAALLAMESMGQWPGPRDPASERAVEQVRRRWALIERRARELRGR